MTKHKCIESTGASIRIDVLNRSGCMHHPLVMGSYPKRMKRYVHLEYRVSRSMGDVR